MGRPRKPENKKYNIRNFYVSNKGYCRYVRPDTGEEISLGSDVRAAAEVAIQANERLMFAPKLLEKVLGTQKKPELVGTHLDYMLAYWLKRVNNKKMSRETYESYSRQLENFRKDHGSLYMNLGEELPNTITKKHFSTYFDKYLGKLTMRKNVRAMLITVWTQAVGMGWSDVNLPKDTLSYAKDIEVQRERLDFDTYKKIRSCAPPHWQNIFDFALQTLQRREDLAALLKDQITREVNAEGKTATFLRLVQIKSEAPLLIELGPEVEETLRKLKDDVISRHVIHWPYGNRKLTGQGYNKNHLTRAFESARTAAIEQFGLFKGWTPAQYPTFHEIRSTGAQLYKEMGYDEEMIQCLLGHETAKMTQLYLSRRQIKIMESKAGINLNFA